MRTYISGDMYMSAQHPTKDICFTREMLCGHISPGIYVRTISDKRIEKDSKCMGYQTDSERRIEGQIL